MTKLTAARIILTIVLVAGVVASFVLDWSANHLLNPAWHAHARFHGALLLFFWRAYRLQVCGCFGGIRQNLT